jgi:hypothetical protein
MDDIWTTDRVFGDVPALRKAFADEVFAHKTSMSIRQLAECEDLADPDIWAVLFDGSSLQDFGERHFVAVWDVLSELRDCLDDSADLWIDGYQNRLGVGRLAATTRVAIEGLARERAFGSTTADTESGGGYYFP